MTYSSSSGGGSSGQGLQNAFRILSHKQKFPIRLIDNSHQLACIVERAACGREITFSDAFSGTWKPHHFAQEFSEQLGEKVEIAAEASFTFPSNAPSEAKRFLEFSSFVGKGIDDESVGDLDIFYVNQHIRQIIN